MIRILCCVLFFAITGYGGDRPPKLRLSEVQDVVPLDYAADMTLDPAKDGFKASIEIKIQVAKPSRILWLNAGRIEQIGTPRELIENPANDFVRDFVMPGAQA